MDVPTLILLGAAGGLLRGLLDFYARFLNWRTDRHAHRQTGREGEPPQLQEYFDAAVESVAALLHSGMGAAAAVLFGTTGQISGAYAAIVVGLSAPVLLTQLSRIQSVSDALTPGQPPAPITDPLLQPAAPPPTPLTPHSPPEAAPSPQRTENGAGRTPGEPPPRPAVNGRPAATPGQTSQAGPSETDLPPRPGRFATEGEST